MSDNPALGACGERSSARASLVLAALAHAEGDSPHAIELLSGSGIGRSPSTIAYARDLARRLDVVAQHTAQEQIWGRPGSVVARLPPSTSTPAPSKALLANSSTETMTSRTGAI